MRFTWFGAAGILVEAAGERILFDPFVELAGGENPNSLEDFLGEEHICITHGHLDHLMEIPELLDEEGEGDATVYCGGVAAGALEKLRVNTGNVVLVKPGMSWTIGDVRMTVRKGKHGRNPAGDNLRRLFSIRTLKYFRNALALAWLHPRFPEGNQTYIYELEAEGRRVLIMGSLGLAEEEEYPEGADLFVLPYQGSAYLEEAALSVVERLRPKRILLDHFDDAFPPVSRTVDTRAFKKLMEERFPEISVVKPVAGKPVELPSDRR